jgi:hypothetical protein
VVFDVYTTEKLPDVVCVGSHCRFLATYQLFGKKIVPIYKAEVAVLGSAEFI